VIPPRILEGFKNVPVELIDPCRPHSSEQLTTTPRDGMRPIRDVLVHTMSAEAYWMRHVIGGELRPRFDPNAFTSLDAILGMWTPQRAQTIEFVRRLTPELDCHQEPARARLRQLLEQQQMNAYTVEKSGVKKLIYQAPWYTNGQYSGFVEISLVLPVSTPHFVRDGAPERLPE
jgi:hypothetical protein